MTFRSLLSAPLLLLFPVFFISAAEQQFDIDAFVHQWAQSCKQYMTPQELHLTANIAHLLHANAVIDIQLQKFFTPLDHLTQKVRACIINHSETCEDINLLKKHIEKLSYIKGTAIIYANMLNICLQYYDEHQTETINAALSALQLAGQQLLFCWSRDEAEKTNALLATTAKNFAESAEYFHTAASMYQGLSEGNLPVKNEDHTKALLTLDIILKTTPQIMTTADSITNMLNHTSDHAMQMIAVGEILYKEIYAALYDIIMQSNCTQQYKTTMFSMHGLLPDEYKTALPHPDQVFPHMLQTAKLYTQTEIVS